MNTFFFFPTFVEGLVETFQVGAVMWKRETIKPPIFLLRVKPARIKTFSDRCAKFSIIRLSAIGRELWKVVLMENFKARQCCFCAPCQRSQVIQRSTSCAVSPRSAQTGQMITTSPLFRRKCASERTGARLDIFNLKCSSPTSGFKKWESVFVELLISIKFAL